MVVRSYSSPNHVRFNDLLGNFVDTHLLMYFVHHFVSCDIELSLVLSGLMVLGIHLFYFVWEGKSEIFLFLQP